MPESAPRSLVVGSLPEELLVVLKGLEAGGLTGERGEMGWNESAGAGWG
jgi:hypothetical protein